MLALAGRNAKTRLQRPSAGPVEDVGSVLARAEALPEEEPDEEDRQAMQQAREDVRSGEYVVLDELLNDLDSRRRAAG